MAGELKEFFRSEDDRADLVDVWLAPDPFAFVLQIDISHRLPNGMETICVTDTYVETSQAPRLTGSGSGNEQQSQTPSGE